VRCVLDPLDMPQGEAQAACPPCEHCGRRAWMVDGDGLGKFWLLCILHDDPVTCAELPSHIEVRWDPEDAWNRE
jgi:hypothetical protein